MWYDGKNALFVDGPAVGEVTAMKIGNEGSAPIELLMPDFPTVRLDLSKEPELMNSSIDVRTVRYTLLRVKFPFVWCYTSQLTPTQETYDRAIRLIEMMVEQDHAERAAEIVRRTESRFNLLERQVAEAVRKINTVADNPLIAAMLEITNDDRQSLRPE